MPKAVFQWKSPRSPESSGAIAGSVERVVTLTQTIADESRETSGRNPTFGHFRCGPALPNATSPRRNCSERLAGKVLLDVSAASTGTKQWVKSTRD